MKFDMIRFNLLILSVIFYAFISCGNAFAGDIPKNENQTDDVKKADAPKNKGLVFNFDNADLTEVIRTLAELLEINYMLDAGVGGTVTSI